MAKASVNGKVTHEVTVQGDHISIDGVRASFSHTFLAPDRMEIAHADGLSRTEVECLDLDTALKRASLRINGAVYEVELKSEFDLLLEKLGMGKGSTARLGSLKAPMPGMVLDVLAQKGDTVLKDQPLVILEAMKMENVIKSPRDGQISKVAVVKGTAVEKNALLVEFVD